MVRLLGQSYIGTSDPSRLPSPCFVDLLRYLIPFENFVRLTTRVFKSFAYVSNFLEDRYVEESVIFTLGG